jgi:hypothetical protein
MVVHRTRQGRGDHRVTSASEMPVGATVRIMRSHATSTVKAAEPVTEAAQRGSATAAPRRRSSSGATRLRLGAVFPE